MERIHLKFLKHIFQLKNATPSYMVYGETGRFPIYINVYCRMISYWVKFLSDDGLIDWLIDYLRFYVPLKSISLIYGDVTIAGEGLQNLSLCSELRAFEQGGIFIVPHLLWHGTSVFPVSSEGPPHLVAFYDTCGDVEDLF
jgi:hypothetical protein